jgi:hypothetical protein
MTRRPCGCIQVRRSLRQGARVVERNREWREFKRRHARLASSQLDYTRLGVARARSRLRNAAAIVPPTTEPLRRHSIPRRPSRSREERRHLAAQRASRRCELDHIQQNAIARKCPNYKRGFRPARPGQANGERGDGAVLKASNRQAFSTPPYAHDVFVSYSHGDPMGTGKSPLANWTHRLIDELVQDIRSVSTEFDQLALWDDREADPTLKLTGMLKNSVSQSALLLVVMSPRYLASAWCKDELQWFEKELHRRGQEEGCTLVVRALPTREEQWPAPLKDERGNSVLGFWFHPRPAREDVRPFGWPDPQPADREFFNVLTSLSTAVMQRLRKLKQRAALKEQATKAYVPSPGKRRIYLHARDMDVAIWRQVRDQLKAEGLDVYPANLNQDTNGLKGLRLVQELRRRRVEAYLDCDMLLILRPQTGAWINDELKTVGFDELRQLDAFYQKRIPCAVLDFVDDDDEMQHEELNITRFAADAAWPVALSHWLNTCLTVIPDNDADSVADNDDKPLLLVNG